MSTWTRSVHRDNEINHPIEVFTWLPVNKKSIETIYINSSNNFHQPIRESMQITEPKEQRITRSYRIKPELNERFTRATDKYANVKSKIIEQAIERYVIAHE